jgi:hypothetical protein
MSIKRCLSNVVYHFFSHDRSFALHVDLTRQHRLVNLRLIATVSDPPQNSLSNALIAFRNPLHWSYSARLFVRNIFVRFLDSSPSHSQTMAAINSIKANVKANDTKTVQKDAKEAMLELFLNVNNVKGRIPVLGNHTLLQCGAYPKGSKLHKIYIEVVNKTHDILCDLQFEGPIDMAKATDLLAVAVDKLLPPPEVKSASSFSSSTIFPPSSSA